MQALIELFEETVQHETGKDGGKWITLGEPLVS
jgi:hypothetical protein